MPAGWSQPASSFNSSFYQRCHQCFKLLWIYNLVHLLIDRMMSMEVLQSIFLIESILLSILGVELRYIRTTRVTMPLTKAENLSGRCWRHHLQRYDGARCDNTSVRCRGWRLLQWCMSWDNLITTPRWLCDRTLTGSGKTPSRTNNMKRSSRHRSFCHHTNLLALSATPKEALTTISLSSEVKTSNCSIAQARHRAMTHKKTRPLETWSLFAQARRQDRAVRVTVSWITENNEQKTRYHFWNSFHPTNQWKTWWHGYPLLNNSNVNHNHWTKYRASASNWKSDNTTSHLFLTCRLRRVAELRSTTC